MAIFTFITYMSLFVSEWKHCMFLVTIILTIAYYICGFIYLIGKLLHFIFVDVYI